MRHLLAKYGNGAPLPAPEAYFLPSTLLTGWLPNLLRPSRGAMVDARAGGIDPPQPLTLYSCARRSPRTSPMPASAARAVAATATAAAAATATAPAPARHRHRHHLLCRLRPAAPPLPSQMTATSSAASRAKPSQSSTYPTPSSPSVRSRRAAPTSPPSPAAARRHTWSTPTPARRWGSRPTSAPTCIASTRREQLIVRAIAPYSTKSRTRTL